MESYHSDQGVSPVVGIILVVAITVALSAVIGVFVMDLGNETTSGEQRTLGVQTATDGGNVTVQVVTGNAKDVKLLVNGTEVDSITAAGPGDTLEGPANENSDVAVVTTSDSQSNQVVSSNNPFDSGEASGEEDEFNPMIADFESGSLSDEWSGTTSGWQVKSSPVYNGSYALVQTDGGAAHENMYTTNGTMAAWEPGMNITFQVYPSTNDDYHGSKPRVELLYDGETDSRVYISHNHATDNGGGKISLSFVNDGSTVASNSTGSASSEPDFPSKTWYEWTVSIQDDGSYIVTVVNTDNGVEKARFTGENGSVDPDSFGDDLRVSTGDDPPTGDAFDFFRYEED